MTHLTPDILVAALSTRQDIAVTDGAQALTGPQLLRRAGTWTDALTAVSAQRVAWRMENGIDWIALDLATLLTGRVAIPIPDFFSPTQVHYVLAASGADTWIGSAADALPDGFETRLKVADVPVATTRVAAPPAVHAGTAKITFTSGTTGDPKGVCLSAATMLRTADALRRELGGLGVQRHLCALPLSLLLENVAGVYANILNGSTLVTPTNGALGLTGSSGVDIARFVRAQQDANPHSLILVPQLLLALIAARSFGIALPESYRFVAVGGGRVAPSLLDQAVRAGLPVYEGYGLSECGSVVTLNTPGGRRAGTVGRPLPHVRLEQVDGELTVAGSAMLGYLGGPAAGTVIHTGDLGDIDAAGFVSIQGRRRNCFITAFGRNVSPEWVESELTAEPDIAMAAVFGEALASNVAVLVTRHDDAAAIAAAVSRVNARLPDYARIGAWHATDATSFRARHCVTANGRIRRDTVAAVYAEELAALMPPDTLVSSAAETRHVS